MPLELSHSPQVAHPLADCGARPPTVEGMYASLTPSAALLSLAAAQDGVFSSRQVIDLGGTNALIRRFVRDGHWHRVASGILATTASPTWRGLVWAGVLLGGSSAIVGGAAAAHLHGIGPEPSDIDIWAPDNAPRSREPWRFHRERRTGRSEPTRVSLAQATLDVCCAGEADDIAATLAAALNKRRSAAADLRALVEGQQRLRHRQLILSMLSDVASGAESALEMRYLRDVKRAHGLPIGTRQVGMSAHSRTDVGYLEQMVLVELDGRLGHEGIGAWRDWKRDNEHAVSGHFTTLRYGWHDVVHGPCEIAWQVAEILTQGGWTGLLQRCGACRSLHHT